MGIYPIMTIIFTIIALASYGSQAEVLSSWSGSSTYANLTYASANHKYLLFKSTGATAVAANVYTLKANVLD